MHRAIFLAATLATALASPVRASADSPPADAVRAAPDTAPVPDRRIGRVTSKDGTPIAYECAGTGPELLIVHGGAGDRTRWTPLMPYLSRDHTVCAMDRRAHGESGDGADYSLAREAEDVVAVAESRGRPVAVLAHSFGAVSAYEAAFRTRAISALMLYEPPLQVGDGSAVLDRMDALIRDGDRAAATALFMREIVHVSPGELDAMQGRPSWNALTATIGISVRQHRELMAYRFDANRAKTLRTPTLLLIGGRTKNPDLVESIRGLEAALPDRRTVVLQGQEHNAMDTDRPRLATEIREFLSRPPRLVVPPKPST